MMEKIIKQNKEWIDSTWEKIQRKLEKTAISSRDKIPYTTKNGIHDDKNLTDVCWWTNGFWPALMWLMYIDTKDERYKITAEKTEEMLDEAFKDYYGLHHDVGFMWHISSGVNYRLFGNEKSRKRALLASALLAYRYNPDGGFIRAWNDNKTGWVIIDCMMNIPLLYWASKELNDPRLEQMARHHADKTMQNHIRDDGSVYHIIEYDVNNGEFIGTPPGQGYDATCSSWSRGQSWALYGFVLSYIHTGNKKYLDTAKKVAHYFISAICNEGYIPKCDFRSPDEPDYVDTTAAACAACGLIEIAKAVPEFEKKIYINAALNILKALEKEHCNWSDSEESILQNGTERYGGGVHIPIIYGDYYFVEALYKLRGNDMLFW